MIKDPKQLAKIKTKWVDALRSGAYKQGQYTLRRSDNTYCCLGVLHEIVEGPKSWQINEDGTRFVGKGYAIITYNCGFDTEHIDRVMGMNDTGATFAEIADYIEENF